MRVLSTFKNICKTVAAVRQVLHVLVCMVLCGMQANADSQHLPQTRQPEQPLQTLAATKKTPWQVLENTHWVRDGRDNAPHVVYMFTDPNCTYCFAFRRAMVKDIVTGSVQLRHIMVGLLTEDSHGQAATILGSENPTEAYLTHHKRLKMGGIDIDPLAVKKASGWVTKNTHLMVPMRTISTPTIFYKNAAGKLQVINGFPDDKELRTLRQGFQKP